MVPNKGLKKKSTGTQTRRLKSVPRPRDQTRDLEKFSIDYLARDTNKGIEKLTIMGKNKET